MITYCFRFSMNLMNLMTVLLEQQFIEKLYPAVIASLGYGCYASNMGLVFRV